SPAVRQDHPDHQEGQGARRERHSRRRRPRLADGDPSTVSDEALAARRHPRKNQVGARPEQSRTLAKAPKTWLFWGLLGSVVSRRLCGIGFIRYPGGPLRE